MGSQFLGIDQETYWFRAAPPATEASENYQGQVLAQDETQAKFKALQILLAAISHDGNAVELDPICPNPSAITSTKREPNWITGASVSAWDDLGGGVPDVYSCIVSQIGAGTYRYEVELRIKPGVSIQKIVIDYIWAI